MLLTVKRNRSDIRIPTLYLLVYVFYSFYRKIYSFSIYFYFISRFSHSLLQLRPYSPRRVDQSKSLSFSMKSVILTESIRLYFS